MAEKAVAEKRWGRAGVASQILGVNRHLVDKVAIRAGIPVRELPGCGHRFYDLDAVRKLAEESTWPVRKPRIGRPRKHTPDAVA